MGFNRTQDVRACCVTFHLVVISITLGDCATVELSLQNKTLKERISGPFHCFIKQSL